VVGLNPASYVLGVYPSTALQPGETPRATGAIYRGAPCPRLSFWQHKRGSTCVRRAKGILLWTATQRGILASSLLPSSVRASPQLAELIDRHLAVMSGRAYTVVCVRIKT